MCYGSKKYGPGEVLRDIILKKEKNASDCRVDGFNAIHDTVFETSAIVDSSIFLKYISPVTIVTSELRQQMENNVFKIVQDMGIDIDKDELIKALEYDRGQYAKGYQDAKNEFGKYATWHSCEDGLPNIGEQVLVQTINDTIHLMFYKGESKCWGENINLDICPSLVKYWAPLLPVKED